MSRALLNGKFKLEGRLLSTAGSKQATISVAAIEDPKCTKYPPRLPILQVI
jgi:hypothetical protein